MSLCRRLHQHCCAFVGKRVWLLGFIAHEAPSQRIKATFHSKCVALQCRLAPAMIALLIADFDEKPTWKDAEVLNGLDLGHVAYRVRNEKERWGKRRDDKTQSRNWKQEKTRAITCVMIESCEWRGH